MKSRSYTVSVGLAQARPNYTPGGRKYGPRNLNK